MIGNNLNGNETEDVNLAKCRGLYSFQTTEESRFKAKKQQVHGLGSFSLFNDLEHESASSNSSPRNVDRPVTPINESIKVAPKTYAGLAKLIHRRIHPRPELEHISVEDQSSLGAVIMGEVNTVWPLLRNQLADPFLSHQQNRELHRRITVHCVTVCEHLFLHYADKIKTLNDRGIFTNSANMSRIRGQLAVDAGKYLNILSVRRHIVADLKKPPMKEQITYSREKATRSPSTPARTQSPKQLSFRKLIKSSRPRRKLRYQFNLNAEIQNMQSLMPSLSLSKVEALMEKSNSFLQSKHRFQETLNDDMDIIDSEQFYWETDDDKMPLPDVKRFQIHHCPSDPMIPHTLLLDEILQIEKEEEDYLMMRTPSMVQESHLDWSLNTPMPQKEQQQIRCHTAEGMSKKHVFDEKTLNYAENEYKEMISEEELRKIKEESEERVDAIDDSDELPPLIQAITRRQAQDEHLKKLKQKERELDQKYEEELKERMKPLPKAQYPQPPIVQSKLPGVSNPMTRTPITIRASDVKINDRVDLSSVTLQLYETVYNDLSGDISQATVKELDANLFQGGELREVYTEIMKTVPNLHQKYDNDPLITSPASNVDLSKILASSTLVRPRSQQVINPRLCRDDLDVPWEGQHMNTRRSSYKPYTAYPDSETTSVSQGLHEDFSTFHRFTPSQLHQPGIDKGSRAYASWLQWWKSTVNSDDFFKYLSTQDTDFLSVIFHFFDSEYNDSDLESMGTDKLEAQREREKRIAELKKEKEEYIPGLWNVKTVILGGLGKDPILEEDNEMSDVDTPLTTSRSQHLLPSPGRSFRTMSQTPRNSFERNNRNPKLMNKRKIQTPINSKNDVVPTIPKKTLFTKYSDGAGLLSASKGSRTETGDKDSAFTSSDFESDVSKSETKNSFPSSPTSNSEQYFPSHFRMLQQSFHNLCQSRDGDSILKIVQSKNLQKAILEGYSPRKSENGEQSETCTSGYHSASSDTLSQDQGNHKNHVSTHTERLLPERTRKYSTGKLKAKWKKIKLRSVFLLDSPIDTKEFLSSKNHVSQVERIIVENRMLNRHGSSPRSTTFSSKRHSNNTQSQLSEQGSGNDMRIQERLEVIWQKLRMPDSQKLDCALKYSSDDYVKFLPEITLSWEKVTDTILRREKLMSKLELFEKEASDPNRFFEKGEKGSSVARLNEAKTRASLYKKLEYVEAIIRESLSTIRRRYSDVVTFDGRPYDEKMSWDRIEMLYFLQQERRCIMLKEHGHPESLEAFISHGQIPSPGILPPIRKKFAQLPMNSIRLTVPE